MTVFARHGADPSIGRKLAEMLGDAGLADVTAKARAPVYPAGHPRRTVRPDMLRSMRRACCSWSPGDVTLTNGDLGGHGRPASVSRS
jgi:hypothetical protein